MKQLKFTVAFFVLMAVPAVVRAQTADPQSQALKQFYNFNKKVALASAEKMPAEHYGFKPANDVRNFAELMGHIADGNYLTCSGAKGEPNPNGDVLQKTEKTAKTKEEVLKALKASFDYCDAVFNNLTDATLKESVKFFGKEQPKAQVITLNVYHGGEHYGNAVVYLRMKGIVPPSSEPAPQQPKPAAQEKPAADESRPPQFDLGVYQLGLLRKGPNSGTGTKEDMEKIQAGHMANIHKMAADGKLFAAGPMMDDGDLRGIFIFKAASLEEAKALAVEDPAIKAGRLRMEIYTWMAPKGIGEKLMEEYRKNPKVPMTMKKHHFVLLKNGPNYTTEETPELQKMRLAHLWNIRRMLDSGKLSSVGPLQNAGNLIGIFVFATESFEEAKAWAESDPMVKAGRLVAEIHPWFVAKEVWQ